MYLFNKSRLANNVASRSLPFVNINITTHCIYSGKQLLFSDQVGEFQFPRVASRCHNYSLCM